MMVMVVEKLMELLEKLHLLSSQQGISTSTTAVRLEDLPDEILVEIFLRLPSESIHRLQSVSKKLCKMIGDRRFANLHILSAAAAAAEVPRLIMSIKYHDDPGGVKGRPITLQLMNYNPVSASLEGSNVNLSHSNNNNAVNIFSWSSLQVRCVFPNLFCLASKLRCHPHNCFLFNPLPLTGKGEGGGEVVMLPSVMALDCRPFEWYGMGMGFDAKTNTYKVKVVGIQLDDRNGVYVAYIYELGTSVSWRPISSAPPLGLSTGVSAFGNMFYWWRDYIISFDFNREKFGSTPMPNINGSAHCGLSHLLTLRGSLAIVDINTSSNHIEIWVLSDPNKEWTLDYKIQIDACLTGPDRGKWRRCSGEWEHGLFFVEYHHKSGQRRSNAIFLDLRCGGSIKRVLFPEEFKGIRREYIYAGGLFSFTWTIISLKHYANLLEAET